MMSILQIKRAEQRTQHRRNFVLSLSCERVRIDVTLTPLQVLELSELIHGGRKEASFLCEFNPTDTEYTEPVEEPDPPKDRPAPKSNGSAFGWYYSN